MSKQKYTCSWCGKTTLRYPSEVGKHVFCCKHCRSSFLSKKSNPEGYIKHPHLTELNQKANPNKMTFELREKLRNSRLGKGEGKTYTKTFGRHTHRMVAEQMLGRKLLSGEVVHHIDGNRRNNSSENLMVFKSQKEHAAWHARWNELFGAPVHKEVVPI